VCVACYLTVTSQQYIITQLRQRQDPKHSTTLDKLNNILHEKPFEIHDKDHEKLKLQLIKLGEMSQNPKFAAFKDRIPSIVDSHIQNLLEPKSSEISR
jgi:hypothetical protein